MANGWGGRRPGAGRKRGGFSRLTKETIEKALAAPCHPVDFLLQMVADEKLAMKERGAAAQSLLPYVATKLSAAEVTVTSEHEQLSEIQLIERMTTVQAQLRDLGVPIIEGEAERIINGSGASSD
jgi:hypothetical protein